MSFAELFIVICVGLIIIGPERLPHALKSGLVWLNRIKRLMHETRTEFENQLGVDEIRREIHNEQVMASLKALEETKKKLRESGEEIENTIASPAQAAAKALQTDKPKPRPKREIRDDFEEDESLFGDQRGNHPEVDDKSKALAEAADAAERDKPPSQ